MWEEEHWHRFPTETSIILQIVDFYIVAVGFKPSIRCRAQTQNGSGGDKGQKVEEACARLRPGICFVEAFRGGDESEVS